jgi:methyl-accepting chemotaxis protein
MFKKSFLSIRVKLTASFALVAAIIVIVGFSGVYAVNRINTSFAAAAREAVPSMNSLLEIKGLGNVIIAQTSMFELLDINHVNEEASPIGQRQAEIIANVNKIDKLIERYKEISGDASTNQTVVKSIAESRDRVVNAAFDFLTLKERGADTPLLQQKKDELVASQETFRDAINRGVDVEQRSVNSALERSSQLVSTIRNFILISLVGGLILSVCLGLFISRSITIPLMETIIAANEIGKGNLEVRIKSRGDDELGVLAVAFNDMSAKLKNSLEKLDLSKAELAQRADEVLKKNTELQRLNTFMIDRELKMVELKKEIEELRKNPPAN